MVSPRRRLVIVFARQRKKSMLARCVLRAAVSTQTQIPYDI